MPNGNASFNLSEQEAWFAPLSQAIGDVARRHNLLVDKYYHDGPSWSLRFNHPRGGQASVTVSNAGPDVAKIDSVWHLDDYDRFTRFLHWRKPREVPKDPDSVRRELELEFSALLSVPLGEWNQVATGYERVWSSFSKAAFLAMTPKYPDPIP